MICHIVYTWLLSLDRTSLSYISYSRLEYIFLPQKVKAYTYQQVPNFPRIWYMLFEEIYLFPDIAEAYKFRSLGGMANIRQYFDQVQTH